MFKRIAFLTVIAILSLSVAFANPSKKTIVLPVDKTNPTDGKQMYSSYCAPCHGIDGRGGGPVASELKSSPTDLTVLAREHKGKFPDLHVNSVLRFGTETPAHGSAAMPIWGHVLGNMNPVNAMDTDLRIANLTHYLESMQQK